MLRDNGIEILRRPFLAAGRFPSLVGPERLCYHRRPRSASYPRHRANHLKSAREVAHLGQDAPHVDGRTNAVGTQARSQRRTTA